MNISISQIILNKILILSCIFLTSTSIAAEQVVLTGNLSGIENDDGITSELYLSVENSESNEEEQYFILEKGLGKELFDYVYEVVKITGIVRKDKTGKQIIEVKNYVVIEPIESEEPPENTEDDGEAMEID